MKSRKKRKVIDQKEQDVFSTGAQIHGVAAYDSLRLVAIVDVRKRDRTNLICAHVIINVAIVIEARQRETATTTTR